MIDRPSIQLLTRLREAKEEDFDSLSRYIIVKLLLAEIAAVEGELRQAKSTCDHLGTQILNYQMKALE